VRAVPQGKADEGEDLLEELHGLLADALLVLVSVHFLAALKYQLIDHDDLIRRMLPADRLKSAETEAAADSFIAQRSAVGAP
jgi:cytochrome b561